MRAALLALAACAAVLGANPGGAADTLVRSDPAAGYARRLESLINEYRQQSGLAPLAVTDDLAAIALEHTVQMANERRLSHDGFRDRFNRTNARICVENVGWNLPFPEAQLDGWRASPGHHRNLLEPKVTHMGVAVSRAYVTFFACS